MHLFFSNKVDLSQETSILISRKGYIEISYGVNFGQVEQNYWNMA